MKLKREFYSKFFIWKYKFLKVDKEKIETYIEKKARQLADLENVKVFNVSSEEMNKNETDKNHWACGLFIYINDKKQRIEYEHIIRDYQKIYWGEDVGRELIRPRIELSPISDVFTLIHELGHYYIYKKDEKQSEDEADFYIDEFFDEHLPPFFKWCCQIMVNIRTEKIRTEKIQPELKFSDEESFMYWKDYQMFIGNVR